MQTLGVCVYIIIQPYIYSYVLRNILKEAYVLEL